MAWSEQSEEDEFDISLLKRFLGAAVPCLTSCVGDFSLLVLEFDADNSLWTVLSIDRVFALSALSKNGIPSGCFINDTND